MMADFHFQITSCQVSAGWWTVAELVARQQHHVRDDERRGAGWPVRPVWEVPECSTDGDRPRTGCDVGIRGCGAASSAQIWSSANLSWRGRLCQSVKATDDGLGLAGWHRSSSSPVLHSVTAWHNRLARGGPWTDAIWCEEKGDGWRPY